MAKFLLCNTLTIVEEAVRVIKSSTLKGAGQKLWNEVVTDSKSLLPVVEEIENILSSEKPLGGKGFEDIELSDVAELLDDRRWKIFEKNVIDVIILKVNKRGKRRLLYRTERTLK